MMKLMKHILLVTTACIASDAVARERAQDMDVQIRTDLPQIEASMTQGKFLIRQREYGLAVNVFRKVLRTDPDNADAYNAMAIAYDGLGRPDLARKNFELALAYAPLEQKHYRNLARHLSNSGELALAGKVMQDFEIAQQKLLERHEEVLAIAAETGHDQIAAMISSLPTLAIGDSSQEKPAAPQEDDLEISESAVVFRRPEIAKDRAGGFDKGIGNSVDSEDEEIGASPLSKPAGASFSIEKAGMTDLYEVMADVYESFGNTEGAEEHRLALEIEKQLAFKNSVKPESLSTQDMDGWLQEIAQRQSQQTDARPSSKTVKAPDFKSRNIGTKLTGAYLSRQSLGEVLLTTRVSSSHTVNSRQSSESKKTINNALAGMERGTGDNRNETRQYYAAVRLILDSGTTKHAVTASTTSFAMVMKEIDLSMADLKQKRLQRLPRIDQGPSPEMERLAANLYRYADAEMRQNRLQKFYEHQILKFVDYDVCVGVYFRSGGQCIA